MVGPLKGKIVKAPYIPCIINGAPTAFLIDVLLDDLRKPISAHLEDVQMLVDGVPTKLTLKKIVAH